MDTESFDTESTIPVYLRECATDVLTGAADLSDESLQCYVSVFFSQYEKRWSEGNVAEAHFMHAIVRLLCAERDKRASDWRAIKASIRQPRGIEPVRNN